MTAHTCAIHTPGTLTCYNGTHACRCPQCLRAKTRYDQWIKLHPRRVDAAGTIRRLQALAAIGWPLAWLDSRLGYKPGMCAEICRRRLWVWPSTATRVHDLYETLWNTAPPEGTPTEQYAVRLAKRRARDSGWLPPMAVDDDQIDDPAYRPRRDSVREAS